MSRTGVTPRKAPRVSRGYIPLYNRYIMKLCFAGATHPRQILVREQFRVILKTPLMIEI
jgi:hypothetical protein